MDEAESAVTSLTFRLPIPTVCRRYTVAVAGSNCIAALKIALDDDNGSVTLGLEPNMILAYRCGYDC